MPSGRTAHPHITDNKDGTVTVKYSPTERGLHEMDIKYDGNHIPGNTTAHTYFICYVGITGTTRISFSLWKQIVKHHQQIA